MDRDGRCEPNSIELGPISTRGPRRWVHLMEGPVDHFVKLDKLPDGFEFPLELKDRIQFDPVAHKLVFHGYMSKTDFDRLCQLTSDWSFRRTLEDLFRLAIPEVESRPEGMRRLLAAVTRLFSLG
jgi:hypothetical protein